MGRGGLPREGQHHSKVGLLGLARSNLTAHDFKLCLAEEVANVAWGEALMHFTVGRSDFTLFMAIEGEHQEPAARAQNSSALTYYQIGLFSVGERMKRNCRVEAGIS